MTVLAADHAGPAWRHPERSRFSGGAKDLSQAMTPLVAELLERKRPR